MKKQKTYSPIRPAAILALSVLTSVPAMAQDAATKTPDTIFSNSLFNMLLAVVILLLILIVALSSVLKNMAGSDFLMNKLLSREQKDAEQNNNNAKITGLLVLLCLGSLQAFSQDGTAAAQETWLIGGLTYATFFFMTSIIFIELIVIALLIGIMKYLLRTPAKEQATAEALKPKEKTILEKFNASVEIEKEEEILLDHNYDGIRELDNNLPPWWKWGFVATIIVACFYLIHFHITKTGDLQLAEYKKEMDKAQADIAAYMKTAANNVDETSVKLLTASSDLESGKQLFVANCAACHGKAGEGNVGPNLTDDYWLHGGSIQDVFKTVKYGWPDKGMKSWKEDLSPVQIAEVASYIKSLHGSNPANGKAPQGDLYQEGAAAPADSTHSAQDTTHVLVPGDTLITKNK